MVDYLLIYEQLAMNFFLLSSFCPFEGGVDIISNLRISDSLDNNLIVFELASFLLLDYHL